MITKAAAGFSQQAWNATKAVGTGIGATASGIMGVGYPVYQYMSGEDSIGGAAGAIPGGYAGSKLGKTIMAPIARSGPLAAAKMSGANMRRSGNALLHASKGAKGWAKAGLWLGGHAKRLAGTLMRAPSGIASGVGSIGGGFMGWEAGRNIGNKYLPIHKRQIEPQVKQAALLQSAVMPTVKKFLPKTLKGYAKAGGGVVGTGLAAYYGNKHFNETRDAAAQSMYQPMYPQQFYPVQQAQMNQ